MGILIANLIRRTRVGGVSYFNLTRSKNGKRRDGHWYIEGERIYISCPFCGKIHDVSTHMIRADGLVSPCIVCVNWNGRPGGCGRYLHVILKKWDLGYREEKSPY